MAPFVMPSWARSSRIVVFTILLSERCELCGHRMTSAVSIYDLVLAVLHRQQNAGALVDAVAILFGKIVDALTCCNLPFTQQRLADRFTKFRRSGARLLQGNGKNALEDLERVVGMRGKLTPAVWAVFRLISGVEGEARLFG